MDITKIQGIREEMERVEARKLQPHFIGSFFIEAFQHLGGSNSPIRSERKLLRSSIELIANSNGKQPILPLVL
ncbi:MAG: hypothetical protein RLZZ574_2963 [Cyanobacteriota bacterium]|jgi:hypothetical protein